MKETTASKDLRARFETLLRDTESIINSNSPFKDQIQEKPMTIIDIMKIYMKFDRMRNSVPDADKLQKMFEDFLEQGEEMVKSIRASMDALLTTVENPKIDESKAEDIAKTLGEQVKKFRKWLMKASDEMDSISDEIKGKFSIAEHLIQGEMMRYIKVK